MPLYDYVCVDCGHRFEVRQGIREDSLTECPECHGTIRRVIHPVGIVFKGSGFYITDSRKKESVTTPAGSGESSTTSDKPDKSEKKEAAPATAGAPAASSPSTASGQSSSSSSSSESSSSSKAAAT